MASDSDSFAQRVLEALEERYGRKLTARPPSEVAQNGDITAEQQAFLLKHLRGLKEQACPKCGHLEWSVGTVSAAPAFPAALITQQSLMPVVSVVCERCCFVEQFAWLPLLARMKKAGIE